MTVTINGVQHALSNDYATDTGQSWGWDGPTPNCPQCQEPLSLRAGWAHVCTPTSQNKSVLVCTGCEWETSIT